MIICVWWLHFSIVGKAWWMWSFRGWFMGVSDLWACLIDGRVWLMGVSDWWVCLIDGRIWLLGTCSELLRGSGCFHSAAGFKAHSHKHSHWKCSESSQRKTSHLHHCTTQAYQVFQVCSAWWDVRAGGTPFWHQSLTFEKGWGPVVQN